MYIDTQKCPTEERRYLLGKIQKMLSTVPGRKFLDKIVDICITPGFHGKRVMSIFGSILFYRQF